MVCYGMVCYGMVWHGMIWYGMVWYQSGPPETYQKPAQTIHWPFREKNQENQEFPDGRKALKTLRKLYISLWLEENTENRNRPLGTKPYANYTFRHWMVWYGMVWYGMV